MKFHQPASLAIWMLLAAGCNRPQHDIQTGDDGPSLAKVQKGIPAEGERKTIRKQMGDDTYVHLAWFHDNEIAGQLLSKLEKDGIRAVSESGLGVTSVWVLASKEADAFRVLQSDAAWMAARVEGDAIQ